ncbi:MAG TPA: hypothetical protein VHB45_10885 [Alloacidobacterium sp.]|nr:hypothetical protein [Alloacidobacterium sp.]
MQTIPVLELQNITKRYRGIAAVENVSFQLQSGDITCLEKALCRGWAAAGR